MSYGMTLEQYWDGDPTDAVYFRKLNEMQQDRMNERLWLQGMYIYDAILRLAPALQAMGGSKPEPYPEKPYQIRPQTKEEQKDTEKQQMLNMQAYLERLILQENDSEGGN